MLTVDNIGSLRRSVEYVYKTQNGDLRDTVEYLVAEAAKPVQQKPVLDDDGNQVYDEQHRPKTRGETVPEWVTRVTDGARLFKRNGVELTAQEAADAYDDMAGLIHTVFRAITEHEAKN
jgi:hypothetical protein